MTFLRLLYLSATVAFMPFVAGAQMPNVDEREPETTLDRAMQFDEEQGFRLEELNLPQAGEAEEEQMVSPGREARQRAPEDLRRAREATLEEMGYYDQEVVIPAPVIPPATQYPIIRDADQERWNRSEKARERANERADKQWEASREAAEHNAQRYRWLRTSPDQLEPLSVEERNQLHGYIWWRVKDGWRRYNLEWLTDREAERLEERPYRDTDAKPW